MPPTGKWSTQQLVIVAIATAAAAILLFRFFGPWPEPDAPPQNMQEQDDEERPPVIISNGSIDFETDSKHPSNGRNKWTRPNAGDNKTFVESDPNGAPVAGFLVETVQHNKTKCRFDGTPVATKPPFVGTSVTVIYGAQGMGPRNATMTIVEPGTRQAAMKLVVEDAAELTNNDKRLVIPNPSGFQIKVLGYSVGKYVCELADAGQTTVKVSQLK